MRVDPACCGLRSSLAFDRAGCFLTRLLPHRGSVCTLPLPLAPWPVQPQPLIMNRFSPARWRSSLAPGCTIVPMSRLQPNRSAEEPSRRKRVIYLTGVGVLLLLAAIVSQVSFDLNFLRPDSNQQIVVFASLELLIFLLFVALTFVLVRNLLKLFAERRLGVLGSKFRTRLVGVSMLLFFLPLLLLFVLVRNLLKLFAERRLGVLRSKFRTRLVVVSLLLSFLPVIVMFWFAYGLMNHSLDKWFSSPVEEVRRDTAAMASLISTYAAQNARAEAVSLAAAPETEYAFSGHSFSSVGNAFRRHAPTLQGGFAVAILDRDGAA